jgi:hypothetical protein
MKYLIVWVLAALILAVGVAAEPPFLDTQTSGTGTLNIVYPKFLEFDPAHNVTLHFHVHNSTGYLLDNTTTMCFIHTYNQSGHINEEYMEFDDNLIDFEYDLNMSKYTYGIYTYLVYCNSTDEAGYVSEGFFLADPGTEYDLTLSVPIGISLTMFSIFLVITGIVILMKRKNDDEE